MKRFIRENRWFVSAVALVLVFGFLCFDLVTAKRLFKWDAWYLFWPMYYHLSAALARWEVPLWEPRACCGFPFHADPQNGVFYPITVIAGLVLGGDFCIFQFLWLLHWLAGGLGFFFLMKRLGLSPTGAFAGSVAFIFNGFFIGQASHTVCIVTMAYIPWVLLVLDQAHERRVAYAVPAGVLFGLAGLGGHPGLTIYAGLFAALWCLLKHGKPLRTAVVLAIAFLTASVVLSPAYLSFLIDGQGFTDRVGFLSVHEACNENRFPLSALISLIFPGMTVAYPDLFGTTPDRVAILNGYFGILGVLSLAVVAIRKDYRTKWRWLLLFMLIVFLFCLGSRGGIGILSYYLLPPLRFVRHPSYARVFWMLGGCILAGWLFERIVLSEGKERSRLLSTCFYVLSGFITVGAACFLLAWLVPNEAVSTDPRFVSIFLVPNSLALAIQSVNLQLLVIILFMAALFFCKSPKYARAATTVLLVVVVIDAAAHVRSNRFTLDWNGQAQEVTTNFQETAKANKGRPLFPLEPRYNRASGGLGNQWVFDGFSYVRAYIAMTSENFNFLVGNSSNPYSPTSFVRVLERCPKFWLTPTVIPIQGSDTQALGKLRDTGDKDAVPVFVHSPSSGQLPAHQSSVPGSYGSVELTSYMADEVTLSVQAPQDCWLFSTERYASGWRAYVDGTPVELHKANFCFRALQVPAGRHTVRMRYEAWVHRTLMVISWLVTFCVLVVWGLRGLLSSYAGFDACVSKTIVPSGAIGRTKRNFLGGFDKSLRRLLGRYRDAPHGTETIPRRTGGYQKTSRGSQEGGGSPP